MKLRKSVFSGNWYPDTALECEKEIKNFIKERRIKLPSKKNLIGGIVPHAGWFFSGSIACNVIFSLQDENPPDLFVVFGMHLHQGSPNHIMTSGSWETPFGEIQIESNVAGELAGRFAFDIKTSEPFYQDNTIELQLPFIKYFFPDVKFIPIGVPPLKKSFEIGKAVAEISKNSGLRTKVLGSTDLTHYGVNYGFMPEGSGPKSVEWVRNENDKKIIDAILSMDPYRVLDEAQDHQNACCSGAAATVIAAAKQLGAKQAEIIDYATSYDKNPGSSFVGYVGIVF